MFSYPHRGVQPGTPRPPPEGEWQEQNICRYRNWLGIASCPAKRSYQYLCPRIYEYPCFLYPCWQTLVMILIFSVHPGWLSQLVQRTAITGNDTEETVFDDSLGREASLPTSTLGGHVLAALGFCPCPVTLPRGAG